MFHLSIYPFIRLSIYPFIEVMFTIYRSHVHYYITGIMLTIILQQSYSRSHIIYHNTEVTYYYL